MLRLFSAIGIVAGLCAAASLIYYMTDPNAEIRLRPVGRADTQVLGAFAYNIAAICAFAALCQCRHRALRGALCTSIGLCMAVVVLTQSRVALAVLLLAIAVGGIYLCRNQLKPMLAAGLLAACIITIFAMVDDTLPNYVHGLIARGDSYRMELWAATCDKIREAPWVGHGMLARIDYYMTATYHTNSPHNIFLTTALAIGIPGLAVFLMALGHMLWHILRQWRNISPFTVLLLINSLSSGMIDHSRIVKGPSPLWMVFWLPLAMGVAALIRLKTPSKEVP
jgi:O-antigen ligase